MVDNDEETEGKEGTSSVAYIHELTYFESVYR